MRLSAVEGRPCVILSGARLRAQSKDWRAARAVEGRPCVILSGARLRAQSKDWHAARAVAGPKLCHPERSALARAVEGLACGLAQSQGTNCVILSGARLRAQSK